MSRVRDIVVGGGEAWEIVESLDEGRQVRVRLVAGEGSDIRSNEVPISFLKGRALYRRVGELDDIDVKRAGAEIARYVPVDRIGWDPRKWVDAFLSKHPPGTEVPDATILLGWMSRLIDSGEARFKAELEERKRVHKPRSHPKDVKKAKRPVRKTPRKAVRSAPIKVKTAKSSGDKPRGKK